MMRSLGVIHINHNFANTESEANLALNEEADVRNANVLSRHTYPGTG